MTACLATLSATKERVCQEMMMNMPLTVSGPSITQTLSNICSIAAAQAQILICQAFEIAHIVAETAV